MESIPAALPGPVKEKIIPNTGCKLGGGLAIRGLILILNQNLLSFWKSSELAQLFEHISMISSRTGRRAKPYIKMKPRLRTCIHSQKIKSPTWSYNCPNSSIVNPSQGCTHNKSKCIKGKKEGQNHPGNTNPLLKSSDCYFRVYDLK